jgi:hypothetical protein
MSGRLPPRNPRMSRKPSVATRTVFAIRPVRIAFVATVVPCERSRTRDGLTPDSASSSRAATSPNEGSSGVEGTFATRKPPSLPTATASVNVPPTSTATTQVSGRTHLHDNEQTANFSPDRRGESLHQGRRASTTAATEDRGRYRSDATRSRSRPYTVPNAGPASADSSTLAGAILMCSRNALEEPSVLYMGADSETYGSRLASPRCGCPREAP